MVKMKLSVKMELLKFCSAVFNSVFLALGLSLAGCGIWILFGESSFLGVLFSGELRLVALALLVIGVVVAALSVVGCVGASCENRSLLMLYMGFLIILLLGQLYVILLMLINSDKIQRNLEEAVYESIVQYGDGDVGDRLVDNMQHYGSCCGLDSPADWLRNSDITNLTSVAAVDVLPCSCFRSYRSVNSPWCSEQLDVTEPLFGQGNGTFQQGCKKQLSDWLKENSLTIVGMAVGLILIQALQFVVAVFLYRSFGLKAVLENSDALVDRSAPDQTAYDELDHGEDNDAYEELDGDDRDQDAHFMDPHHPPQPPVQDYWDYQGLPQGF